MVIWLKVRFVFQHWSYNYQNLIYHLKSAQQMKEVTEKWYDTWDQNTLNCIQTPEVIWAIRFQSVLSASRMHLHFFFGHRIDSWFVQDTLSDSVWRAPAGN